MLGRFNEETWHVRPATNLSHERLQLAKISACNRNNISLLPVYSSYSIIVSPEENHHRVFLERQDSAGNCPCIHSARKKSTARTKISYGRKTPAISTNDRIWIFSYGRQINNKMIEWQERDVFFIYISDHTHSISLLAPWGVEFLTYKISGRAVIIFLNPASPSVFRLNCGITVVYIHTTQIERTLSLKYLKRKKLSLYS